MEMEISIQGSDAAGAAMVNRYPAAGGQVPSLIDGNAICPLEKKTDAKKLSFMS